MMTSPIRSYVRVKLRCDHLEVVKERIKVVYNATGFDFHNYTQLDCHSTLKNVSLDQLDILHAVEMAELKKQVFVGCLGVPHFSVKLREEMKTTDDRPSVKVIVVRECTCNPYQTIVPGYAFSKTLQNFDSHMMFFEPKNNVIKLRESFYYGQNLQIHLDKIVLRPNIYLKFVQIKLLGDPRDQSIRQHMNEIIDHLYLTDCEQTCKSYLSLLE